VTYAPLIESTGWPAVYDVTDDWLLAPFPDREIDRLRGLEKIALDRADEVVVCSPALAQSRGRGRPVTVIPNGVDVEHFRRPRPRPADLPPAPTAVYVGTLHESRLDVELVAELAAEIPGLQIGLVGPDSLDVGSHDVLLRHPNVHLLGPRPYDDVPAYLQHADVVVVPHVVSPFTESLDPIKAYECLAIDTPTVATPVAGFRDHADAFTIADRDGYVAALKLVLDEPVAAARSVDPASWDARGEEFERILRRAVAR
jgi:glycosyltransferase involved in cell wall biosynthesis